jgi:hypothetical protein
MRSETLGRRNTALVQSTELDHSSCVFKDRGMPADAIARGGPSNLPRNEYHDSRTVW